jgi:hypothetical protein
MPLSPPSPCANSNATALGPYCPASLLRASLITCTHAEYHQCASYANVQRSLYNIPLVDLSRAHPPSSPPHPWVCRESPRPPFPPACLHPVCPCNTLPKGPHLHDSVIVCGVMIPTPPPRKTSCLPPPPQKHANHILLRHPPPPPPQNNPSPARPCPWGCLSAPRQ